MQFHNVIYLKIFKNLLVNNRELAVTPTPVIVMVDGHRLFGGTLSKLGVPFQLLAYLTPPGYVKHYADCRL